MSHTTLARRSGHMSRDRSTPVFTGHAEFRATSILHAHTGCCVAVRTCMPQAACRSPNPASIEPRLSAARRGADRQLRVLPEQRRELFLRRVPTSFSTRASRLQMSTEETKIRSVRYSFLERAVGMSQ
jgi:hypothetical protein